MDYTKPISDKLRKRKSNQKLSSKPKKFKSIENLGNKSHNDTTINYDLTNMATFTTLSKTIENDNIIHDQSQNQSQNDSFFDNYYLGLSYIKNENSMEQTRENQNDSSSESEAENNNLNHDNDINRQSNSTLSNSKEKSLTNSLQGYPRIIDVPGNSSMSKAYNMKDVDQYINEQNCDNTMLTRVTNHSTAGVTTFNDTMNTNEIPPPPSDVQILSTQYTEKTSTYNYLPKELLESNENMNITNFQIHTCKDSVLSPMIPCIACSNEKNWKKSKSLPSRIGSRFKKWTTPKKKRSDKSVVYTSSTTLTVPIYFGDQLASPKDQNRHHHRHHRSGDSSKKGSGSFGKSRGIPTSSPSIPFLFPNKATQNPLPITHSMPTLNHVIETKKSNSEILPIAHDINKKNSSIRIKKDVKAKSTDSKTDRSVKSSNSSTLPRTESSVKPSSSSSLPRTDSTVKPTKMNSLPRTDRSVSLKIQFNQVQPKQIENGDQTMSQIRPHRKNSDAYQQNRHKGIIYYANRKALEKKSIQGNVPQSSLNSNEKKRNGYNDSVFSNPKLEQNVNEIRNVDVDDIHRTPSTKVLKSNSYKRRSKSFKTLYKDICILGLSIDRLAEKYGSN